MCPTRDQTYNLGMCHDREQNLQPFGAWHDAQPTEPPGQSPSSILIYLKDEKNSFLSLIHPHPIAEYAVKTEAPRFISSAPQGVHKALGRQDATQWPMRWALSPQRPALHCQTALHCLLPHLGSLCCDQPTTDTNCQVFLSFLLPQAS